MKKVILFLLPVLIISSCNGQDRREEKDPGTDRSGNEVRDVSDIRIRDPYILPDARSRTYYLYVSKGSRPGSPEKGVEAYQSKDLKSWSGPFTVFTFPDPFWADYQVWAPEVHAYDGKYYLFVTLSSRDTLATPRPYRTEDWPVLYKRATQVFFSDSPEGPFHAFDNKPHTPEAWSSLDGTLWVENGIPYMVFCHEWTQVVNGTMEVVPLREDLSEPAGEPVTLFRAGDAPWVTPLRGHGMITDGPFLHNTPDGKLLMIWSSFGSGGYSIGQAVSASGSILGPWKQEERIFDENGGHGMLFTTFEGELILTFHQPNTHPDERARFYRVKEKNGRLILDGSVQW